MKDLYSYGKKPDHEWKILPWIPSPRPPFKIWDQIKILWDHLGRLDY